MTSQVEFWVVIAIVAGCAAYLSWRVARKLKAFVSRSSGPCGGCSIACSTGTHTDAGPAPPLAGAPPAPCVGDAPRVQPPGSA